MSKDFSLADWIWRKAYPQSTRSDRGLKDVRLDGENGRVQRIMIIASLYLHFLSVLYRSSVTTTGGSTKGNSVMGDGFDSFFQDSFFIQSFHPIDGVNFRYNDRF